VIVQRIVQRRFRSGCQRVTGGRVAVVVGVVYGKSGKTEGQKSWVVSS